MIMSNTAHPVRSSIFQEIATCWPAALNLRERSQVLLDSRISAKNQDVAARRLELWADQFKVPATEIIRCWSEELKLEEQDIWKIIGATPEELKAGSSSEPEWLDTLGQVLDIMESEQIDREQDLGPDCDRRGIAAITWPWVRYSKRCAVARLHAIRKSLAKPHFDPELVVFIFVKRLQDRLYQQVERTSILELNVARVRGDLQGVTQEERYFDFCRRIAQPEFAAAMLAEYPVLCRLLTEEAQNWIRYVCELVERLESDWTAIQQEIMSETEISSLSGANLDAGDTHAGGRAVAILEFASGKKLIYKPRSVEGERLLAEFLALVNQHQTRHPLREYKVLDRGRYGWCEYVGAGVCNRPEDLRKFYYREGALLALGFVLRMDDVHSDNLIAAVDHPVIVDAESIFHVPFQEDMNTMRQVFDETVAAVGMLPCLKIGANMVDTSALGGGRNGVLTPFRIPVDDGRQADDLRIVHKQVPMMPGRNLPGGADQDGGANTYVDDMKSGFEDTYRFLVKNGKVFLEKLLVQARRDPCLRFVARPTRLYGRLLRASTHPNLLRDALDREALFNKLWPISGWTRLLIPYERADLWEGAIPTFARAPGRTELWSSRFEQVPVQGWTSGADAVRSRFQRISEGDLKRHLWTIQSGINISASASSRNPCAWAPEASPEQASLKSTCLSNAVQIARRLMDLSYSPAYGVGWMDIRSQASNFKEGPKDQLELAPIRADLYSGLSGMALFFGYLNDVHHDEAVLQFTTRICSAVLEMVERDSMSHMETGLMSGVSGVLYALSHVKRFCPSNRLRAACEKILKVLNEFKVGGSSFRCDIVSGSAGIICALLSCQKAFQDSSALELALQHGEHILRSAEELPSGLAWKETNSTHLTGFAHGAAGIAYALGRVFQESGDERFRNVAIEALRFERSAFNEQTQNWKDNRDWIQGTGDSDKGTVAWCTGAPGIGMSRLGLSDIWQDARFENEITAACRTTLKRGLESDDDCICHGNAGNLEFLNDVSRKRAESGWMQESHNAMHAFSQKIAAKGFSFEGNVERLSLMTGLAGCGYSLLRFAEPDLVPSILLLRPPNVTAALHIG